MKEKLLQIKEEIEKIQKDEKFSEEDRYELINLYSDIKSLITKKQNELESDYFIIEKVEQNLAIIYAISYRNPSEQIERITEQLKDFNGVVIMDCLLCNGTGNRLFESFSKENELLKKRRNFNHLTKDMDLHLKEKNYLNKFYSRHLDLFEYNNILSSLEKQEILDQIKELK